MRLSVILLALVLSMTGCSDRAVNNTKKTPGADKGGPITDSGVGKSDLKVTPPAACKKVPADQDRDVDVLFVMDNSGSMEQEQKNARVNFAKLVDGLRLSPTTDKLLNLRIGVVSTDLGAGNLYTDNACQLDGDKGKLHNKAQIAGCRPPTDAWIEYQEDKGLITTNVPGSGTAIQKVKDAFNCIAALGTDGCGFEQTLMSAKRALDPAVNVNPGFLRNGDPCQAGREDAILAVMFLTDEDDCSAANAQLYDPSQQGLNDPLGPLTSFRCFEFGVKCECPGKSKCDRFTTGVRKNCVPGGQYLHKVENFTQFFQNLKKSPARDSATGKCMDVPNTRRLVMAAIAGPADPVEVGVQGQYPILKPSCSSSQGFAVPAVRIKSLVRAFAKPLTAQEIKDIKAKVRNIPYFVDGNGTWRGENFSSICASDFSPALQRFAEQIKAARGTRCQ